MLGPVELFYPDTMHLWIELNFENTEFNQKALNLEIKKFIGADLAI